MHELHWDYSLLLATTWGKFVNYMGIYFFINEKLIYVNYLVKWSIIWVWIRWSRGKTLAFCAKVSGLGLDTSNMTFSMCLTAIKGQNFVNVINAMLPLRFRAHIKVFPLLTVIFIIQSLRIYRILPYMYSVSEVHTLSFNCLHYVHCLLIKKNNILETGVPEMGTL
jgi:hypothetical protein